MSADHEVGSEPVRVLLERNLQEATFKVRHMSMAYLAPKKNGMQCVDQSSHADEIHHHRPRGRDRVNQAVLMNWYPQGGPLRVRSHMSAKVII